VKLADHRSVFTQSNARLKRARQLYIKLCTPAILASHDDAVMDRVAKRLVESGLYAAASIANKHDMRYRIARIIFNLERQSFGGTELGEWSFWLTRNGFGQNFRRIKKTVAA